MTHTQTIPLGINPGVRAITLDAGFRPINVFALGPRNEGLTVKFEQNPDEIGLRDMPGPATEVYDVASGQKVAMLVGDIDTLIAGRYGFGVNESGEARALKDYPNIPGRTEVLSTHEKSEAYGSLGEDTFWLTDDVARALDGGPRGRAHESARPDSDHFHHRIEGFDARNDELIIDTDLLANKGKGKTAGAESLADLDEAGALGVYELSVSKDLYVDLPDGGLIISGVDDPTDVDIETVGSGAPDAAGDTLLG